MNYLNWNFFNAINWKIYWKPKGLIFPLNRENQEKEIIFIFFPGNCQKEIIRRYFFFFFDAILLRLNFKYKNRKYHFNYILSSENKRNFYLQGLYFLRMIHRYFQKKNPKVYFIHKTKFFQNVNSHHRIQQGFPTFC